MIDWAIARSFIGLKFRTIRRTPQALIGLALGLLVGGGLSALAVTGILALRSHRYAELALALGLSAVAALWVLGPLVLGGGEVIIDVRRFSLYPINRLTLVAGMLLASFVGVPALATAVVVGATISHAPSMLAVGR